MQGTDWGPATDPHLGTPAVIAHRGASDEAPEHTLAAYRKALADGADGLECDVRLTRDGHLVCVHDRRIDRTSTGTGPVSVHQLDELAALDWGSWRTRRDVPPRSMRRRLPDLLAATAVAELDSQEAPDLDDTAGDPADPERARILTLERLCEVVADVDRPVDLAIEAKHPTRYGGFVERQLHDVLHRFGWAHPRPGHSTPARFMSFSGTAVRRMQTLAPRVPAVLLMERIPPRRRGGFLPHGIDILGPRVTAVRADPDYVDRVHAAGGQVHVWTVDADDDVRLCRDLGVEAIITNRPRRVLDLLGR